MYESYYGLTCEPFSVAADPRFFFLSSQHRQARAHLQHGLRRGAGFLLLSGEIGAGKTTVCRLFMRQLPDTVDVAFVVNPRLDARGLLTRVCDDLRIEVPAGTVDLIDLIHEHLLLAHALGRRTLIVVDEAQALSFDVMEQLRLLTNLDATGSKLQVFLIGQPELREMLRDPALESVAQRVVARFHLAALDESQTATYIAHRLAVAGLDGALPFDDEALRAIHRLAGGVPRRINVLCDQCLVAAEAAGIRQITAAVVEPIATQAFDDRPPVEAVPLAPPLFPLSPAPAVDAGPAPVAIEAPEKRWPRYAVIACGAVLVSAMLGRDFLMNALNMIRHSSPRHVTAPAPPLPPELATTANPLDPVTPGATVTAANPPETPASAAALGATAVPIEPPVQPQTQPLPPAPLTATDRPGAINAVFAAGALNEDTAWTRLAQLWGVNLPSVQPCAAGALHGLRCFRASGGLVIIRQLNRPGILKLVAPDGRTAYVLLVGLGATSATFQTDATRLEVPLTELVGNWHGEFATLWRSPPGFRPAEALTAGSAVTQWMGRRLAIVDGSAVEPTDQAAFLSRLSAFQLSHGLQPDGRAGPLTLMQLNQDSGIDEPKLAGNR